MKRGRNQINEAMMKLSTMGRSTITLLTVLVAAPVVLGAYSIPSKAEDSGTHAEAQDIITSVKKDNEIAAKLPDEIKKRGGIRISVNANLKPVKFVDSDGDIIGFNPSLLRAAAKILGTKALIERGTFDSMVPGLESKRYDVIGSIGDFVERQTHIDFIDYLQSGDALLASADFPKNKVTYLDLCGLRVGYTRGTSQHVDVNAASKKCAAHGKPKVQINGFPEQAAGVLAVRSGQSDMYWGDLPSMSYNATKYSDLFKIVYKSQDSVYGIGIRKDETALRDALHAALQKLVKTGVYSQLLKLWGLQGSGVPKLPLNSDNRLSGS